jgi:hypothetical protein
MALLIGGVCCMAVTTAGCGGGSLSEQATALQGSGGITAVVDDAAAEEAAAIAEEEARAEAARDEYSSRVADSLAALRTVASASNNWWKAYETCIDRSPYIDDFAPCWESLGRPERWTRKARDARRKLRSQIASEASSPSCNEAASRVDGRIGDLLAAWANFEETVGAAEVDLANSARDRVDGSTDRFFNSARAYERKCENPDDIS